ncbi:MAG: putative DNA binding domain-containing protein, partial [Gammaproteobacteria bacterium]|nr:putative DNA binding domain-containing protein [Gammaproteobacteria bacterium]
MPIDIPSFWQQVALGEDSDLELKEVRFRGGRVAAPRRDDLADAFAAFANAQGGRLVLGIDDDRQPQSLDAPRLDALADFVKEVCSDKVDPALDPRFYRVPVPDSPGGRGVLVVDIAQGITVHRSPGGHFRRRGDSQRQMGADEIRRLTQSRGQSDIAATDTQIVRGTSINSLRPELWRSYASSRTSEPAEVVLGKLKFLKGDAEGVQRATVGGVLLGADNPTEWLPNAYMQAVCYQGVAADGASQLDAQDLVGPLDRQIRDAMRFVVRNRRVAASKRPGRIDVPQYSERAVFEAVVNAVVHRDYSIRGSRIRLFMFDDRLELYSPGGLCNSMTTEDL